MKHMDLITTNKDSDKKFYEEYLVNKGCRYEEFNNRFVIPEYYH